MYYRIKDNVALRKWKFVDRAIYVKGVDHALGVSPQQFGLLLKCDGESDINPNPHLVEMFKSGYIEKCEKGDRISDWSRLKEYDNLYFPRMNLMITGKCNLNCIHCFNAKDNAPLNTEWDYDELLHLLDEARDIGVHAFTITGGEPMVHPRFLDIIKAIYERDMYVFELNTNGMLISQQILDEFKKIGCFPLIKISFDGVGYHNWMRQNPKAEDKTIEAIKLCLKNGFRVKAQVQVNRKNVSVMMDTVRLLDGLGVQEMRMIKTTEVPRWEENSPQSTLTTEEYYIEMLKFAQEFIKSDMKIEVDIWQFVYLNPILKQYNLAMIKCNGKDFNIRIPMCRGNRGMIAISSSGEAVPCLQMSGYFMEKGKSLANVKKTPLKEVISNTEYSLLATATLFHRIINNEKCPSCKYFKVCTGGCPALGLLYSGEASDYYHEDITKCYFFENGWYEKVTTALKSYRLTNPIEIDLD